MVAWFRSVRDEFFREHPQSPCLLDIVKGADLGMSADGARLVLDFNYAHNPS